MLRVVADPNVLVSAVLTRTGPPAVILDRWRDGEFDLVVSPALFAELEDVLLRPKFLATITESEARAYVDGLSADTLMFSDPDEPNRVASDPDDDYVVALAVAAGADLIVSGDAHLTGLVDPPIPVLTPREFMERFRHP